MDCANKKCFIQKCFNSGVTGGQEMLFSLFTSLCKVTEKKLQFSFFIIAAFIWPVKSSVLSTICLFITLLQLNNAPFVFLAMMAILQRVNTIV